MNGKDIFLGLKYVGEDLVEEAEYGSFPAAEKKKTSGIRTLGRKPLMIAALIGLMLFLMGCAWVVMKMQDLKIGQTTGEEYVFDESGTNIIGTETVNHNVLTLAGLEGSAPYKANAAWYAYREELLASISQMEQDGSLPEGYWQSNTYWDKLNAKADQLAKEHGLKPQGQKLEFRTTRNMCDALGIERFQTDLDAVAVTVKDGKCYDNGNFYLNMDFSFQDNKQYDVPDTWGILYWNWKDCFSPDYVLLKDTGDWKEWNYTTATGTNVLILRSESDWNGYIICDREDALMTLRVEARRDLGNNVDGKTWFDYLYLTDRQMEQLADAIDFGINPQVVSQEDVENQPAVSGEVTQDGYTVKVKKIETDGCVAYITIGITAPEGVDIVHNPQKGYEDRLYHIAQSNLEDLIPAMGEIGHSSGGWNPVEDGDGLNYTQDFRIEANYAMTDGSDPFVKGTAWSLHIEDLIHSYFDEEKNIPVDVILAEGEWLFPIPFSEEFADYRKMELVSEPVTVKASVGWGRDGEDILEEVKITSFVLRRFSADIACDNPDALFDYINGQPLLVVIYETIKAAISVKQAAEHYGLKVSRNSMACCPFHNDRHPSLKLNEEYFFCFGCGAKGDVIDFVARLFDLSSYEAAQRLAADFGISTEPGQSVAVPHKPKHPYIRQFREDEMLCFRVLTDYLHLLEDWKVRYAPQTPDDALDDRFVEALQMHCHIEYMADVLTVGDLEERVAVVDELMKGGKITFLQDYTARKKKEDMSHERRNDADLAL